MSAQSVEALLARLYTDRVLRARFIADPASVAAQAGLGPGEAAAFANIDRIGLELAAESYELKRMAHQRTPSGWREKLRQRYRYFVSKTSR